MRFKFALVGLGLMLAACQPVDTSSLAPPNPAQMAPGQTGFALAPDARVTAGMAKPASRGAVRYDLSALIDHAQSNNPKTRAAWARAKQAATAVGLVESAYLPQLSALVLAGGQRSSSAAVQDPFGILPAGTVTGHASAGAAVLSVQWLLFDFGFREATRTQAKELSQVGNIVFAGVHQKLIYDVTQAFYSLYAARERQVVQARRLEAAEEILGMARARRESQLATITDIAQAEQVVAQARFDLTRAQSASAAASVRLATTAGLPAQQRIIPVLPGGGVKLPSRLPARVDAIVEDALQRRPDLQAAFARVRASEAGVAAAEASFRPRLLASATLGRAILSGTLDDSRSPGTISGEGAHPVAGLFVGVSIPLANGKTKKARIDAAQAGYEAAMADAEGLRNVAQGEIIAAYEQLKSALAATSAAGSLVATAQTTYDAAKSRADQGLATVGDINLALRMLYDAQLSQVEARHVALSSAATLSFASGRMVSAP